MPGSHHEPENYSIDEMMDRLKHPGKKSEPIPELVTRDDGSQALKVRKRKRRSQQPVREKEKTDQKRKFIRVICTFIFCMILGLLFASTVIYSNSNRYREGVLAKVRASTAADVEISQFRSNPTGANATNLVLTWPEDSPIASLQTRDIRAKTHLGHIFSNTYGGSELLATEGTMTWRQPNRNASMAIAARGNEVDFERISISKFHLVPDRSAPQSFRIRNSEASFYPNIGASHRAQARLNGGEIQLRGLPTLTLGRALIEFSDGEMQLTHAKILHSDDPLGELILHGTIPTTIDDSVAAVAVSANQFRIGGIVGEHLGKLVSGRIDSKDGEGAGTLKFPAYQPQLGILEMDFTSSATTPFQLRGFNFLGELAVMLGEPWFEQPYFDRTCTGTIRRSEGTVELRDFRAEFRNRMAIRGNLRVEPNGRLSGNIDVGLSATLVATADKRRLDPVISEASGGYQWISIEVGGNANSPTDNFMAIVDNPPDRSSPPPTTKPDHGERKSESLFDELTRPR